MSFFVLWAVLTLSLGLAFGSLVYVISKSLQEWWRRLPWCPRCEQSKALPWYGLCPGCQMENH